MATLTLDFAAQLQQSTAEAHDRAENSSFISQLIGGQLDQSAFMRLQQQAWFFYRALEDATDAVRAHTMDPQLHALFDEKLNRTSSLEHDLDQLHGGPQWREEIHMLPATERYVRRLYEIAETVDAPALVAHHYVRYLGDLSGGQVIARMMQRHYGISPDALTFYQFAGIEKLKPYKDTYRHTLNELDFTAEERAHALEEAQVAFLFNSEVFRDLC